MEPAPSEQDADVLLTTSAILWPRFGAKLALGLGQRVLGPTNAPAPDPRIPLCSRSYVISRVLTRSPSRRSRVRCDRSWSSRSRPPWRRGNCVLSRGGGAPSTGACMVPPGWARWADPAEPVRASVGSGGISSTTRDLPALGSDRMARTRDRDASRWWPWLPKHTHGNARLPVKPIPVSCESTACFGFCSFSDRSAPRALQRCGQRGCDCSGAVRLPMRQTATARRPYSGMSARLCDSPCRLTCSMTLMDGESPPSCSATRRATHRQFRGHRNVREWWRVAMRLDQARM